MPREATLETSDRIAQEVRVGGTNLPPPEPPPSPDQGTLRITTLPKTPLEFRNAIGLPEEVIDPKASFESKKQRVESYVAEVTSNVPQNVFASGERNTTYHDNQMSEQLADQRISTKIWRGVMKKRLGWMGIKDPNSLLQTIEGNVIIHERKDFKLDFLVKLLKTLDPSDEKQALAKLNLAFQRARSYCKFSRSSEFSRSSDDLIDKLNTLGSISEEKWQDIYHQFDGRREVIYSNDSLIHDNGFIEIVKNGGLTKAQIQTLDKAVIWNTFANVLPFHRKPDEFSINQDDKGYENWFQYDDLLDPNVGAQIDKYHPYLIDWAGDTLPLILANKTEGFSKYRIADGRSFIIGLKHIENTGKTGHLKMLIDSGWNISGVFQQMDGLAYGLARPNAFEDLDQTLTQAVAFQSDPEKAGWARVISEYFYNQKGLQVSGLPHYEELIKNKDTLISLALILNSLPKQEGISPNSLYDIEKGEIKIDARTLNRYMEKALEGVNISDFDKRYATGLRTLIRKELSADPYSGKPEYLSPEALSVYTYIAMNKDKVTPELFNNFGSLNVKTEFLNDLITSGIPVNEKIMKRLISSCTDQESLSPELIFKYYDDLNTEAVQMLADLPDEFVLTLTPEEQSQIGFIKNLPEDLRRIFFIHVDKGDFSKYISNGMPTVDFASRTLSNGYFNQARGLFTDQLLSTFSPEDQEFFKVCLDLPPEIANLMKGNQSEWKGYFKDGKPTSRLLRMVTQATELGGDSGMIYKLLPLVDMNTFSSEDRTFWEFYKDNRLNSGMRNYLFNKVYLSNARERFSDLIVNGKPTPMFLTELSSGNVNILEFQTIREVLPQIKIEDMPANEQDFWRFYPKIDNRRTEAIRDYLLINKDRFSEFIEGDKPTVKLLNNASEVTDGLVDTVLIHQILDRMDKSKLSSEDTIFWDYFLKNSMNANSLFVLKNRDQFPKMIENGNETPLFYQLLASQEPGRMLQLPREKQGLSAKQYQDIWRSAVGKEVMDGFLSALPKATDEARNAFTGNEYDRTSQFLTYLEDRMSPDDFGLNHAEFSIMTDYVKQFGLARNESIYKYYRQLHMFEHGKIPDLPQEMKDLAVTSIPEMVQRISEIRKIVFGETQLTNTAELRGLTPFQVQLLANVTRYDSARFGAGNAGNLAEKIAQFSNQLDQGSIAPLPEGYIADTIETSNVKVEFNAEAIKADYEVLKGEILESIDNPPTSEQLTGAIKAVLERRIGKINETLGRVSNPKAVDAMTRDLSNLHSYIERIDQIKDLDSLTLSLLGMNFSNEDRAGGEDFIGIDSIMRRVILSKLYQRINRSPGFVENTRIKLSKDEITAEGIDEIVLTVDEMVKNHVLSLDFNNKERYWDPEVFKTIVGNESLRKNFRRITERFNPHAEKLRQEQARFVKTQTGKVSDVRIVPDRGLIGEMAGYLADVCYIRVPDLLKNYSGQSAERPIVIPYKFLTTDKESGEANFLGSVLVFEVQTANGEPALLVRALDIPNESDIDIKKFTESLLDKFEEVGKRRGKNKVLVAGTAGTISNYSATTGHVLGTYVRGKEPEPVSPKFDFNGYDITNSVYIAREVS